MLHDKYLPQFHFKETHAISVSAPPAKIFSTIKEFDSSGSFVIKVLCALRGLPRYSLQGLKGAEHMGFSVLEIKEGEELILGLIGQFWKPNGNIQHIPAADFLSFDNREFVKATWNFEVTPTIGQTCKVSTETRVYCPDEKTRQKFSRYWFFVRPFSGIIRMEILRSLKRKSENSDR